LGRTVAVAIPAGFIVTRTSVTAMNSDKITKVFLFEVDMKVTPLTNWTIVASKQKNGRVHLLSDQN
jgi:hypothetical protein